MANNWRPYTIPLMSGLNTRADKRALPPPGLAVAKDCWFEEPGGLQTRKPFASIGNNILGGGTLSNVRRLAVNGNELLAFTDSTLYAWSDRDTAWVSKGTYLAPKVTERSRFVRPHAQRSCDRAELSGVAVYAWSEAGATSSVYIAAMDVVTGTVLVEPILVDATTGSSRPRVVALTNKILLFFRSAAFDLRALAIDPTNLSSSMSAASTAVFTLANGFSNHYDVVETGGVAYVAARRSPNTSYELKAVTEALVVTGATKARTCDGAIAISAAPNGTHLQIVRGNGGNIQGDYVSITGPFTDVYTAQAVGTASGTVNNIAVAHRSTQDSSQYRCYAFWTSAQTSASTSYLTKYNWVDTGNTLGTEANFARRLAVASRAFDRGGRIFVWLVFAGESGTAGMTEPSGFRAQLQNTYFLYRDDGLLLAKAASGKSGGFPVSDSNLPHVQSLGSDTYTFCGVERRVIPLGGNHKSYAAQAPRDITVTFDSNEARRCARLGQTLYVTGGEVLQYDGQDLTEVGFHIYPWHFGVTTLLFAGNLEAGDYAYKLTYRWDNGKGERDRSTTATHELATSAASRQANMGAIMPLVPTHKSNVAVEVWRTLKNPTSDSPFYLASDNDPTGTTPNQYITNDPTTTQHAFDDDFADSTLATKETNPENGGVLESIAPPPATIIAATQDRLFLAGIADNPLQVWYSRLRGADEVASFHDGLTFDLPPDGGDITALGFLNETLIVFKESAVYAVPGDGFDNLGEGQNYGPARVLATDVGAVSAEAVALTPMGLVFKSRKGWYLLNRGWGVDYIGGPVADYDADTIVSVHVVESQHQVRVLSTSRMLCWDYQFRTPDSPGGQWSEFTVTDGLHAVIWDGTYHYAAATSVKAEQTAYTSLTYGMDVETGWGSNGGLMDYKAMRNLYVLGEYRSACRLRVRVAFDYDESDASGPNWRVDKTLTVTPTTVGNPIRLKVGIPGGWQKCSAYKVRITAVHSLTDGQPPTGEAIKLTALAMEIGFKGGLHKGLPTAQRQ